MKKFGIGVLSIAFLLSSTTFAASGETNQITGFSEKLDTNRINLIANLENSKKKLEEIDKENKKLTNTSVFKAASCIGAVAENENDLDIDNFFTELQKNIINDYIALDGDIKRMAFGITGVDSELFSIKLSNYYNENVQKIVEMESNYEKKAKETKENFLAYVENNSELLNGLALKLDSFENIQNAAESVEEALDKFLLTLNEHSTLFSDLEKVRTQAEEEFEKILDEIIAENIANNAPNTDIQAQYYINKDNFLKKIRSELKKAEYYLFSGLFSYEKYENLIDKKLTVDKKFLNSEKELDCSLLLTTSFNIDSYAKDVSNVSSSLVRGLTVLTDALNEEKINMSILEAPAVKYFQNDAETLTRKLKKNFVLMLKSISLQKEESQEGEIIEQGKQEIQTEKIVFTQAFNKNQYHEQVKVLQSVLKNRGYYEGEITGIYSSATIEAVYQFQLKEGIITGKESNKAAYGRFGAATRARMNSLLE